MALPKVKKSRATTHSRRSNWKLSGPSLVECPQCHEQKLSHHVCPKCGQYNGRQAIAVEEEK